MKKSIASKRMLIIFDKCQNECLNVKFKLSSKRMPKCDLKTSKRKPKRQKIGVCLTE